MGIDFNADDSGKSAVKRLQVLENVKESGSVFVLVSPGGESIDTYNKWLENLKIWYENSEKYPGCAGIWIQDWNKLNSIWRNAE